MGAIGDVHVAGAVKDDARGLVEVRFRRQDTVLGSGPGAIGACNGDRVAGREHCHATLSVANKIGRAENVRAAIEQNHRPAALTGIGRSKGYPLGACGSVAQGRQRLAGGSAGTLFEIQFWPACAFSENFDFADRTTARPCHRDGYALRGRGCSHGLQIGKDSLSSRADGREQQEDTQDQAPRGETPYTPRRCLAETRNSLGSGIRCFRMDDGLRILR